MRFYSIDINILIELSDYFYRLIKDENVNYREYKDELVDFICIKEIRKKEYLDKNWNNLFLVYLIRNYIYFLVNKNLKCIL